MLQYSLAISCTNQIRKLYLCLFLNFFVDVNHEGNNLHIKKISIKQPLTSHSLAWNSFNSRRHFWLRIVENECEYHLTKYVLIICICYELVIDEISFPCMVSFFFFLMLFLNATRLRVRVIFRTLCYKWDRSVAC